MSNQANLKNLFTGRVKLSTVLDRIEERMIKQNKKSWDGDACVYFGGNHTHCAIGCILPKSFKSENIEGLSVGDLLEKFPSHFGFDYNNTLHIDMGDILMAVQKLHDRAPDHKNFGKQFSAKMKKFRKENNI